MSATTPTTPERPDFDELIEQLDFLTSDVNRIGRTLRMAPVLRGCPRRYGSGARMSRVILDLHGARAQSGVDIDALETFFEHFRTALRENARARAGEIAQRTGGPQDETRRLLHSGWFACE